jgi:hypothetical protein
MSGIFSKGGRIFGWIALLGAAAALLFSQQSALSGPRGGVTLWEFCASNADSLTDGWGGRPDWIEIKNTGDTVICLEGFSINDSKRQVSVAPLPDVSLAPGEYLVLCASGREGFDGKYHHLPLKLAAEGEFLTLTDGTGCILQAVMLPAMGADESWGMTEADVMEKMARATPGADNDAGMGEAYAAPMGWVENRK